MTGPDVVVLDASAVLARLFEEPLDCGGPAARSASRSATDAASSSPAASGHRPSRPTAPGARSSCPSRCSWSDDERSPVITGTSWWSRGGADSKEVPVITRPPDRRDHQAPGGVAGRPHSATCLLITTRPTASPSPRRAGRSRRGSRRETGSPPAGSPAGWRAPGARATAHLSSGGSGVRRVREGHMTPARRGCRLPHVPLIMTRRDPRSARGTSRRVRRRLACLTYS